jgi:predicted acyl esterase
MAEDQRFASKRNDILWYQTDTLKEPVVVAGKVTAELQVRTTGTDADFVVKLIDVLPDGTQRLVRAEVIRGKFRNSFEKPEPFAPGKTSNVKLVIAGCVPSIWQRSSDHGAGSKQLVPAG